MRHEIRIKAAAAEAAEAADAAEAAEAGAEITHNRIATRNQTTRRARLKDTQIGITVTHTHGYDVGNNHCSDTCQNPGPYHNYYATRENTMGGNRRNQTKTQFPPLRSPQNPGYNTAPGQHQPYSGQGY